MGDADARMKEQAIRFGTSASLIGIVTDPPNRQAAAQRPATLLLGAGIVHRVGPHRLYVKLARQLASMGFVVFRFDFSGIGDSSVREDNLPLEKSAILETREAMDWLSQNRGIDQFVLIAVCSGAGFSFRTACVDERVVGVSLINAAGHRWGTSDELNQTLVHHYRRMLWSPSFRRKNLIKLTTLNFNAGTIVQAAVNRIRSAFVSGVKAPPASFRIAKEFEALVARGVRILIVYSEGDEGWDYYEVFLKARLKALSSNPCFGLHHVPGANHTFTLLSHQHQLFKLLGGWLEQIG
jgi:hypothetical protein